MTIFWGLMIPFIGTTLGALCVLFIKNELKPVIQKSLLGFAAGVMVAASVWSLLIPAMEMSDYLGQLAFLSTACVTRPDTAITTIVVTAAMMR